MKNFEDQAKLANNGKRGTAFVCFRTPDSASRAKAANLNFEGRTLYVSYYEIKT